MQPLIVMSATSVAMYITTLLIGFLVIKPCCFVAAQKNGSLTIGYAVPYTTGWPIGTKMAPAIIQGIREVQRRHLLDGYEISWIWRDTWCQPLQAIRMVVDMKSTADHLDVIIGEGCSGACQPVGLLAAAWHIPFVSMGCISPVLSDRKTYPTFSRVIGTTSATGPAYNGIADLMKWDRVAIIYDYNDIYRSMAEAASRALEHSGRTVFMRSMANTMNGDTPIKENYDLLIEVLLDLKAISRVIYLFQTSPDRRNSLIIAHDLGMFNGEYAFVTTAIGPEIRAQYKHRPDRGPEIFNGVLNRDAMEPSGDQWNKFANQVLQDFDNPAFTGWPKPPANSQADIINVYAGMVHDAVLAWAYGVNKTISQGHSPNDGRKVTENINALTFQGITGTVATDYNGERKPSYKVDIIQNGELVKIMEWRPTEQRMIKVYKPEDENDWSGLLWPGNSSLPPSGSAPCGWNNEFCQEHGKQSNTAVCIAVVLTSLLLMSTIAAAICVYKRKQSLEARSCCVKWQDVEQIMSSAVSLPTSLTAERRSAVSLPTSLTAEHRVVIAKFRSETVVIKRLGSRSMHISDKQVLRDLKIMKDLKHENVNQFKAICLETPNVCVLMLFASRGSLQDLIGDETVNLIWDLKMSMATDIAQGMNYLHQSDLGSHGHLTSSNCVIDSRWICKVTDFGLKNIKLLSGMEENNGNQHGLWTPPEVLRHHHDVNMATGDVYSYGIILQEIVLETRPFGANIPLLENAETIEKVESGNPVYRPHIPTDECSQEWLLLMQECWEEKPKHRPSFPDILKRIKRLNNGKSLVDDMITRLEGHASYLEKIVAERSVQLQEEKYKMEVLLKDLLPESVANKLKLGLQVAPEYFDSVTIFFSDIVSFTAIASKGTPMDVVRMLNMLYTVFDEVSSEFDVYKLATIGDAYFVASGVPLRNGNRHAVEICNMAVQLLNCLSLCSIKHLPGELLQLRVGVHSGPCVAGVTGIKMPRYLLFGDTVDVASKMESSGESMKIHISQSTVDILHSYQHYELEYNKTLYVNNTDSINTYWLKYKLL